MCPAPLFALLGLLTLLPQTSPVPKPGEIQKLLDLTKSGSPVVRPQAAQRLVAFGKPALEAIQARIGGSAQGLEPLGPELLGELGTFDDAGLEALLRESLSDRDFPWRPAVLRALAQSPHSTDLPAFEAELGDVLSAGREGALIGIDRTLAAWSQDPAQATEVGSARERLEPRVRAALADPSDLVRRRAAWLLDRWGHPEYALSLFTDLSRSDRFYDLDTGALARRGAAQLLKELLGPAGDPLLGFEPGQPPATEANQAALVRLEAQLLERAGGKRPVPAPVLVGESPALVFGIELRSCRRGEAWLGLGADDRLAVGLGAPQIYTLPEGSVARFLASTEAARTALAGEEIFGRPGCDVERYRFGAGDRPAEREWFVLKDPAPAADLRPAPLDVVAQELIGLVRVAGGPEDRAALEALAQGLTELLQSVGGPL